MGGIRGVIRNNIGDWVTWYMGKAKCANTLRYELTTFLPGLKMASSNNLIPLEATVDSTEVIQCINKGHLIYDPLICECMSS